MMNDRMFVALLSIVLAIGFILVVKQIAFWYFNRGEEKGELLKADVHERLERAEAALQDAKEELESLRAELTAER